MVAVWDLKTQFDRYDGKEIFDCMIAEFLISEGHTVPTQEEVMAKYKVKKLEELAEKQKEKFNKLPKLYELFKNSEMAMVPVLHQMEQTGIALDTDKLQTVGKEIDKAIIKTEEEIKKVVGSSINLNSSIQLGTFLAEQLKIPLTKTKTGRYATNENELMKHAANFPLISSLLSYRELTKLRSTYLQSLIEKVDAAGRIHTTYSLVGAHTGRLSSFNPNLQNIPVTSHYGQRIKSCFVASPNNVLLSFDYSQQELRILAHLTGEEKLIEAFKNNQDVHKTTASKLFNVKYDEVTKQQRMVAKTINFGIIYGMSSYGMSVDMQIPVEEAQTFIDTFYTTYPKIKAFYYTYLEEGKKNGYVETILGRRRYVFDFPGKKFIDNAMRRVLMNYPIQGSAADLMKKAMVEIHKNILPNYSDAKLLLQVHDDLVFEIKENKGMIKEFSQKITQAMCSAYPLSVPVEVDVKIGKNWEEMKLL